MIHVTLKGGVVRQYEDGATAMDVAKSLGAGLIKLRVHVKLTEPVRSAAPRCLGTARFQFSPLTMRRASAPSGTRPPILWRRRQAAVSTGEAHDRPGS